MKIRNRFVSNSSSASYYITILSPPKETLLDIASNCWYPYLDISLMTKELNSAIQELEALSSISVDKDVFKKEIRIFENYKNLLERKNLDSEQQTKIALELNGITLIENATSTVLLGHTCMHNCYDEGMSPFLKEIALYYSFENPSKITLRIEHHD